MSAEVDIKVSRAIRCDLLKFDKYEPMIKNCKKRLGLGPKSRNKVNKEIVKKIVNKGTHISPPLSIDSIDGHKNPNMKFMRGRIDKIYKVLFDTDPTDTKEYIGWIIKQISNSKVIMPEDCEKINTTLKTFTRLKLKKIIQGIDINQKDIHDIFTIIDSKIEKSAEDYSSVMPEGCTIYLETPNYIKFKIGTSEAASKVAAGTKWCTSNVNTAKNYVTQGLFVIYKKVDGKLEKLWQHNYDLTQVCDLQDRQVPDGSYDEEQCKILSLYDEETGKLFYDELVEG